MRSNNYWGFKISVYALIIHLFCFMALRLSAYQQLFIGSITGPEFYRLRKKIRGAISDTPHTFNTQIFFQTNAQQNRTLCARKGNTLPSDVQHLLRDKSLSICRKIQMVSFWERFLIKLHK